MEKRYVDTVRQLLEVAPTVFEDPGFAIKGGTAINLFLRDMPRLPLLGTSGRVVSLSSAAQSPVDLDALSGRVSLSDNEAYAQSKLGLTMWSRSLALSLGDNGPVLVAVNPGSFLGSKMVKEAYGREGKDLSIGAEILTRAALSDEFADASGKYYDNDSGRFASPHRDALDDNKLRELVRVIEAQLVAN